MRKVSASICAVILLSGCAGIPTTSAIHFSKISGSDSVSQYVRVIARPPAQGATAEDIVRGFLEACADGGDNYSIARQYLDQTVAEKWNPTSGIEFMDSRTMTMAESNSHIQLNAQHESSINSAGFFALAAPGANISAQFVMAQDSDGEWRIKSLPDGLILNSSELEREFRSYPIYFLAQSTPDLVPDYVLAPAGSQGVATTLMRALLSGASTNIGKAVRSSIPAGTKLSFGSVPVSAGIASVDLTSEVLSASKVERQQLAAQIVWTLTSLPNVSAVKISVSGQALAIAGAGVTQSANDWMAYKPASLDRATQLAVVHGRSVFSVTNDGVESKLMTLQNAALGDLGQTTTDLRTGHVAGITSDGHALVSNRVANSTLATAMTGDALSRPSWDATGGLFVADYGRGPFIVDKFGYKTSVNVDVNTLGSAQQIRQIAVAPDGVRGAFVIVEGSQDVLAFGSIFANKRSRQIFGLHEVQRTITNIKDVLWVSEDQVVVLGADSSGAQQIFFVDASMGTTSSITAPDGTQSVAVDSSGQLAAAVVNGSKQKIYRQQFGTWVVVVPGSAALYLGTGINLLKN